MTYKFPKMNLSDAEAAWLRALYSKVKDLKPIDVKELRVQLWDQLPRDFDPYGIDRRLVMSAYEITLLGVWHVDPESRFLLETDKIICCIRDIIRANYRADEFQAVTVSKLTGIPLDEVAIIFSTFIRQLGSFHERASLHLMKGGQRGYSSIGIESFKGLQQYLSYDGLEPLMADFHKELDPAKSLPQLDATVEKTQQAYQPNTAFIMMSMDPQKPELEDVCNAIKDVCQSFEINAVRADDVEHQDRITDVVLQRIGESEFLIADLTDERPNVYYEVGYAHALQKRPILYRRAETKLHFDLSVHNVPEYKNVTDLKLQLTKRFEAILGRSARDR